MTVDADVAVLSACETAKGRFTHADGLVGFARAFFLAGTPRVVASCWRVSDEATRPLVRRFHEALARERLTEAQALRAAQVDAIRRGGGAAHPSRWAAIVLWGLED